MTDITELIDAINRLEVAINRIAEMNAGVAEISAAINRLNDGLLTTPPQPPSIPDVPIENHEPIVLKPRDIATLDFAKKKGDIITSQWDEILDYWSKRDFSFAKTQSSVSLVFSKLLKVGALKEIESFRGGSRILRLSSIGESYLEQGTKRLQSQKKNPNSHQPWLEGRDKILWDDVRPYRDPVYSEIPNGKIVEWAKREGRSNNAIRSRINKYDFHEKTSKPYNNSFHSFGGEEIKIIREAMKEVTNRNKRKLIMQLSEELDRSPLIVKVMIHLYT